MTPLYLPQWCEVHMDTVEAIYFFKYFNLTEWNKTLKMIQSVAELSIININIGLDSSFAFMNYLQDKTIMT